MSYLTAVLLGLVQGIAVFLPISGAGHIALLQNIFQVGEVDLLFETLLHLGSLIAVFMVYRRDIRAVVRGGLGLVGIGRDKGRTNKRNADRRRMAVFIIIGSLPLLLVLLIKNAVAVMPDNTPLVSLMLMLTGTILYLSDRNAKCIRGLREVSVMQAFLVGAAQIVAVFPGISRTGTTISAGLLCGFKRNFAVYFSFLLCVPAAIGAMIVSLIGAAQAGISIAMLPKYLCGMLMSVISGYFSIRFMHYLAARSNFAGCSYYCWGAGLIALMLSLVA